MPFGFASFSILFFLQGLIFYLFLERVYQLLLKPFFEGCLEMTLNNSNISVRWFCDFKVMAGISDVRLRLTFSLYPPGSRSKACPDQLGMEDKSPNCLHWISGDSLFCLVSEKAGSLCPPSVLCWLGLGRGHGFSLEEWNRMFPV